jgi:hypothetical protein
MALPPDPPPADIASQLQRAVGLHQRGIAHCGLEWAPQCLAFHKTERPIRTASALQVRQPIYDSAVGRARAYERFLQPPLVELAGI